MSLKFWEYNLFYCFQLSCSLCLLLFYYYKQEVYLCKCIDFLKSPHSLCIELLLYYLRIFIASILENWTQNATQNLPVESRTGRHNPYVLYFNRESVIHSNLMGYRGHYSIQWSLRLYPDVLHFIPNWPWARLLNYNKEKILIEIIAFRQELPEW